VPNHFIILDANTPDPWHELSRDPDKFHDEVSRRVKKFKGEVVAGVYFDLGTKTGYVVTKGPEDPVNAKAMLDDLPTLDATVMLRRPEVKKANSARRRANPKGREAR
jgi:hypothetical protein